jgi:hypothetical protein
MLPRIPVFTDQTNREEADSIESIKAIAQRLGMSIEEAIRHVSELSREYELMGQRPHPNLVDPSRPHDKIDRKIRKRKETVFDKEVRKKKHRSIDI